MVNFWTKSIVVGLAVLGLGMTHEAGAHAHLDEGNYVVNVNTATQEELETIPGIGPALARRIIAGSPYKRVDDLQRVKGIGKKSLMKMRPYLRIEGKTEAL